MLSDISQIGLCSLLIFGNIDIFLACVVREEVFDLTRETPTSSQNKNLTFTPSETELLLICRGSTNFDTFNNKTWSSSHSSLGLSVTQYKDDLYFRLPCTTSHTPCLPATLKCSGVRNSTNDSVYISVLLIPRCNQNTSPTSTTIQLNHNASSTVPARPIDITTRTRSITQMDYFGVIIGFSICLILGIVSGLIVCIQKQCNARNCYKIFGSRCWDNWNYRSRRTNVEEAEGQRMNKPSAIPMLRFHKRPGNGSYQQGTPHDA